jgi:uncharacterized lipoprotein
MKKIALALLALALLAGCTSKTEYGQCIGAFDDKRPELHYKLSGWNVAMAVIFSETIVVPIVVVADETLCPDGASPKK